MIESLIAGQQFLYQTTDGIVYHVAEKGVRVLQSHWPPTPPIRAFVDGDEGTEPRDFIRCPSVQIIIASSPQGARTSRVTPPKIVRNISEVTGHRGSVRIGPRHGHRGSNSKNFPCLQYSYVCARVFSLFPCFFSLFFCPSADSWHQSPQRWYHHNSPAPVSHPPST
jgi:hypothetical protein